MTQAAILIQSKFRSYYEQKRFQQSRRAAVLIQQRYRSYRRRPPGTLPARNKYGPNPPALSAHPLCPRPLPTGSQLIILLLPDPCPTKVPKGRRAGDS